MSLRLLPTERDNMRRAVGSLATGVTVVTTLDGDLVPVGMTATAFTPVSTDPPSVLICVNRGSRTHATVLGHGRFGVNLLSWASETISDHCAKPGGNKSLPPAWLDDSGASESPMLRDAMAFFDCRVDDSMENGSHVVIVGSVTAVALADSRDSMDPLIHFRGQYRHVTRSRRGQRLDPLPIVFDSTMEVQFS